jgi:uncharacterized protein
VAKRTKPRRGNGNGRTLTLNLDQITGALAGRMRLANKAGIQFGGKRDVYAVAGYLPDDAVTFDHFWSLYKRGDVAGRIVDMPAKTTWRTPPAIVEEGEEETKFTKAFAEFADRIGVWRVLERTDRLAGVGRYAILLIGARVSEDAELARPLTRVSGPAEISYLKPYSEANAQIKSWVADAGDPRFGLPETYQIQISSGRSGFPLKSSLTVHASRVIHVAEDLLEDEVYGRPRLERALNRLFDLDKVAASTGEAYWQLAARILQATIDPAADVSAGQLPELDDKLTEMVHDLRRQFYGKGVKLDWLEGQAPNPSQVIEMYFSLIAGAAGIPKRILFGSELGELASSTDQQSYFGTINERQEQFAEPTLLRALIDRLVAINALPRPGVDGYEVVWPPLFEESEKEKAGTNLIRAQTAQALTPLGGNPLELVEIGEDNTVILVTKAPGDPEDVLPEPSPAPAPPGEEPPPAGGAPPPGTGEPNPNEGGGGAPAARQFDPDQPRDDQGRWADAGGGGSATGAHPAVDTSGAPHAARLRANKDSEPRQTPYDTDEVLGARHLLKASTPTAEINTPARQRLRARTVDQLDARQTGITQGREAWIMLGPPASGKSALVDSLAASHGARIIDADMAKEHIPEYEGWNSGVVHEESAGIAAAWASRAMDRGDNMMLPLVGKTQGNVEKVIDGLAARGYKVHLMGMHVEVSTSQARAIKRFTKTGRFVDPLYIADVNGRPRRTFTALKNHPGVRSAQLYTNEVPRGHPPARIE